MEVRPVVALATSAEWTDLAPDDRAIAPALARLGLETCVAVWTDDSVDWDRFAAIVVRSCWDYHHDLPRWLAWIGALESMDIVERPSGNGRLWNPPALLRWNARKTYLTDLAARGVPTVPTRWLDAMMLTSGAALSAALDETGWDQLVVKPAVSAGALGVHRLRRRESGGYEGEEPLAAALALHSQRGPWLVQPYLREVADAGEWSLIFFDGELSHAVLKRPAPGDYRVQEKHGGTAVTVTPPASIHDAARRALTVAMDASQADGAPLYARVDLIASAGQPLLMEMEVTEPALFLGSQSADGALSAADRLARAIERRVRPNPRAANESQARLVPGRSTPRAANEPTPPAVPGRSSPRPRQR